MKASKSQNFPNNEQMYTIHNLKNILGTQEL